jgi:phosphatidylserine decarboxylase
MEVGALMVGKINNYHRQAIVSRGQEKGKFEFGGSTVVLLLKRDVAAIDDDIFKNTRDGYETIVKMGEAIGTALFE